jgi:hypothetical protein
LINLTDLGPILAAWKGHGDGGTGAAFAQAKGVTAKSVQVELIIIRRRTMFNGDYFFFGGGVGVGFGLLVLEGGGL